MCLHSKMKQLICELVKADGKTHLLCCFESGAASMALCTSLSLSCYTVGLSGSPLWAPVSPKALLLSIVLVFGVLFEAFPYQMCRLQLSYL